MSIERRLKNLSKILLVLVLTLSFLLPAAFFIGVQTASADESFGDPVVDSILDELWWFSEDYLNMAAVKAEVDALKAAGELGDPSSPEFEPVLIAVVDTGISYVHEIFGGVLASADGGSTILGTNVVTAGGSLDDESTKMHGTHVAGILAILIRALGLQDYIKIMPIRASHTDPDRKDKTLFFHDFKAENVIKSVAWAAAHGADVVNMSLTTTNTWNSVRTEISKWTDEIIFTAAAGNDGYGNALGKPTSTAKGYPAAFPEVLGVMAGQPSANGLVFSSYSNVSGSYDLIAPGGNKDVEDDKIYSAQFFGSGATYQSTYGYKHGTSMATPMVSFAAALLKLRLEAFESSNFTTSDAISIMKRHSEVTALNGSSEYAALNLYSLVSGDLEELLGYSYNEPTGVNVAVSGSQLQKVNNLHELTFSASIQPTGTDPRVKVKWMVNGEESGQGMTFKWTPTGAGIFNVTAQVSYRGINVESQPKTVTVHYIKPFAEEIKINIESGLSGVETGELLEFYLSGLEFADPATEVEWYINGELVEVGGARFAFMPTKAGKYTISAVYGGDVLWEDVEFEVGKSDRLWVIPVAVSAGIVAAALAVLTTLLIINKRKAAINISVGGEK